MGGSREKQPYWYILGKMGSLVKVGEDLQGEPRQNLRHTDFISIFITTQYYNIFHKTRRSLKFPGFKRISVQTPCPNKVSRTTSYCHSISHKTHSFSTTVGDFHSGQSIQPLSVKPASIQTPQILWNIQFLRSSREQTLQFSPESSTYLFSLYQSS